MFYMNESLGSLKQLKYLQQCNITYNTICKFNDYSNVYTKRFLDIKLLPLFHKKYSKKKNKKKN